VEHEAVIPEKHRKPFARALSYVDGFLAGGNALRVK